MGNNINKIVYGAIINIDNEEVLASWKGQALVGTPAELRWIFNEKLIWMVPIMVDTIPVLQLQEHAPQLFKNWPVAK